MSNGNQKMVTSYYEVRANHNIFSKYAAALYSVCLLEEGDSILIDAGSSLTPIAKITRRLADKYPNQTHYTIMTHNQAAFNALSDTPPNARFNVFQTGGRYDRDLNASFGHQAEMAYLRYHPKWVFIGHNGLVADLGLFCHGNTEELALKKEIFAMPAWGRVIISDFSKIGLPGGLLFGDSANLTDNVDQCWVITDDIKDQKFSKSFEGDIKSHYSRFDIQVRSLQETYKTCVMCIHYAVIKADSYKKDQNGKETDELENPKFLEDPIKTLVEYFNSGDLSAPIYRIQIAEKDVHNYAELMAEHEKWHERIKARDTTGLIAQTFKNGITVDIQLVREGHTLAEKVLNAEPELDEQGCSLINRLHKISSTIGTGRMD